MPKLPAVTDHAVLRYLERAHGLDVDAVRAHIAGRAMTAAELGALSVKVDGVRLILRDKTVVTVFRRQWIPHAPVKGGSS